MLRQASIPAKDALVFPIKSQDRKIDLFKILRMPDYSIFKEQALSPGQLGDCRSSAIHLFICKAYAKLCPSNFPIKFSNLNRGSMQNILIFWRSCIIFALSQSYQWLRAYHSCHAMLCIHIIPVHIVPIPTIYLCVSHASASGATPPGGGGNVSECVSGGGTIFDVGSICNGCTSLALFGQEGPQFAFAIHYLVDSRFAE